MMERKVALVTGGSGGIGAATARVLATQGVSVAVNYLSNASVAQEVVEQIRGVGGRGMAVQADMQDQQAAERLAEVVLHTYGRLDILVHSIATKAVIKPFEQMCWDDFHGSVMRELQAVFVSTKAVLPAMQRQLYGRIVYVGSGVSKAPSMHGGIGIATAKAGLAAFARYIAKEYGSAGITANVVAPGLVATNLSAAMPSEQRERIASMTPLGRIAQPEDIARVIAFFASDESNFMTGIYAPVNGGMVME